MPVQPFFHAALLWKRPFYCPIVENAPLSRVLYPFPFQFLKTFLGCTSFQIYFFLQSGAFHGRQDVRFKQQVLPSWGMQTRRCLFSAKPCLVSVYFMITFPMSLPFLEIVHVCLLVLRLLCLILSIQFSFDL